MIEIPNHKFIYETSLLKLLVDWPHIQRSDKLFLAIYELGVSIHPTFPASSFSWFNFFMRVNLLGINWAQM